MDRLPRRPGAALRRRPARRVRRRPRRERDDRADARRVAERRADAGRAAPRILRSRLPLRRPGRVRPQRAAARDGSADDDLGHAEVGERRQGAGVPPDEDGRLPELHARARDPLQRPPAPATRSCASTGSGTSRTSATSWRLSSTARARSSARPRTRSSPPPATRGSRPAARGRRSRSARRRPTARTSPRRGRPTPTTPGTFAKMVAQANKKLKFDAWAQHPYPVPVNQGPGAEGALPERRLQHDEAVRAGPRQVVRPQEHPDLDHGVRQRDEAGRAEGRHRGAAGRLRPAGDRDSRRRTRGSRCSSGSSSATRRAARGRAASTAPPARPSPRRRAGRRRRRPSTGSTAS